MDVAIPFLAILVPTVIAVTLARNERRASGRARYLEGRRQAAEGLITALSDLISLDPTSGLPEEAFRNLRARIAIYRAATEQGDISAEWIGRKHEEGVFVWEMAMGQIKPGQFSAVKENILGEPRQWAIDTLEMLLGLLAGTLNEDQLEKEVARLTTAQARPQIEDT